MNVALYGPRGKRWAMTERGSPSVERSTAQLRIGPSSVRWDGSSLIFDIDEITSPLPRSIRGTVQLTPNRLFDHSVPLDAAHLHRWRPIAPAARVSVSFDAPQMSWSGNGYCDANDGSEPIDRNLLHWNWMRCAVPDGDLVFYDITERDGRETSLSLKFGNDGSINDYAAPLKAKLPSSGWRVSRTARSERDAVVVRTLEDTPFYSRSVLSIDLLGERRISVHESLDLNRLRSPVVQMMLPFRMPRRRGRE